MSVKRLDTQQPKTHPKKGREKQEKLKKRITSVSQTGFSAKSESMAQSRM